MSDECDNCGDMRAQLSAAEAEVDRLRDGLIAAQNEGEQQATEIDRLRKQLDEAHRTIRSLNANPGKVVVTSAVKWDAYLDTVRDEAKVDERMRIATWLRDRACRFDGIPYHALLRAAEKLELGVLISDQHADLAAGDE